MPLGAARLNTLSKVLTTTSTAVTGLAWVDTNDSYYLSGSVSSNSTSSVDITVSFWFRHISGMASDAAPIMMYAADNSVSNFTGIEYQGGRLRVVTQSGGVLNDFLIGTYSASYGSGTYDDGEWHHFLFSRDGSAGAKHAYVDGNSVTINVNAGRDNGSANMWLGSSMQNISIMSEHGFSTGANRISELHVTQFFVDNTFIDITQTSNREKFYKFGGAVNMGSDGTTSGLDQPLIFHTGNTSTFATKGGDTTSFPYSVSANGTGIDGDPDDGPQINARTPISVTLSDNAHISTDQAKFGSTSCELDGTNDAIDPDLGSLNIGSGDFTIEFFYYPTDLSTVHGRYFFETGSGVSNRLNAYFNSSSQFVIRSGNTELLKASHGMSTGQWYHLAINRSSGTLRFYRDGTSLASVSNSTNFVNNDYRIGSYLTGGGFGTVGYIDEFRDSSVARYSGSSFTVPTAQFENDDDTRLLLHFEGANGATTTTDDAS